MTFDLLPPLLSFVLPFCGRIVTISALCCAIGLHWVALQSVAWAAMIVANAQRVSLCAAITRTLDGSHPCSLCHVVNAGKTSEKKSDLQAATPKLDLICATRSFRLIRSFVRLSYRPHNLFASHSSNSPPVPPPRLVVG